MQTPIKFCAKMIVFMGCWTVFSMGISPSVGKFHVLRAGSTTPKRVTLPRMPWHNIWPWDPDPLMAGRWVEPK